MLPQEIIRRKRDGHALSRDEIAFFIDGLARDTVGADQAAAFAMATFLQGMTATEAADLTHAMTRSGRVLDWAHASLSGPVLDKHSTGGVGDNISLVLAPVLAACGAFVPMISGRSLGHTGGTLDKLDAIPGFRSQPSLDEFQRVVRDVGFAIIGQTDDLAPADRRLYAIRDVTGTVESIPLITASILSKKVAAGLDGLVMDVKYGSGAFMTSHESARALARSIVDTAGVAGLPTNALLTDMGSPLASCAGNAVEMRHALDHLTRKAREPRFLEVLTALAMEMLMLGGLASSEGQAREQIEAALDSGHAAERFAKMCAALGGTADFLERYDGHMPPAQIVRAVHAPRAGIVVGIDTRALGLAVIGLGGGRRHASHRIDHSVGFTHLAGIGDGTDAPLAFVHARDDQDATRAADAVRTAYRIGDEAPTVPPMVLERITATSD